MRDHQIGGWRGKISTRPAYFSIGQFLLLRKMHVKLHITNIFRLIDFFNETFLSRYTYENFHK